MGLIPCRENVAEVHLVAQNAVRDILRQINCLPIDRHGKPIVGLATIVSESVTS